MINHTFGFIGAGNMAGAIISAMITEKLVNPGQLSVYDVDLQKCKSFLDLGAYVSDSIETLARQSDIIFLAVKPQNYADVLRLIAPAIDKNKVLVSIAAGISTGYIKKAVGFDCKVIRLMPNTPLLLGMGATALCYCPPVTDDEFEIVSRIFSSCGIVEVLPEDQMNAVIAVNGSSPAYVYLFAKSVIDAAVLQGIDKDVARNLFLQTLMGSAQMLSSSGKTPDELIAQVASPGGTTLAALDQFKTLGFESLIESAMQACTKRADALAK